jgi:hypothetical protein
LPRQTGFTACKKAEKEFFPLLKIKILPGEIQR